TDPTKDRGWVPPHARHRCARPRRRVRDGPLQDVPDLRTQDDELHVLGRGRRPVVSVMPSIDFSPLASQYDAGRSLPDWATDPWREVVVEHAPSRALDRVVDVGCGTGYWLPYLRIWLDTAVVGVELSAEMVRQARGKIDGAPIVLSQGRAEALPVRSDTADVLWVSNVLHHVPDLR